MADILIITDKFSTQSTISRMNEKKDKGSRLFVVYLNISIHASVLSIQMHVYRRALDLVKHAYKTLLKSDLYWKTVNKTFWRQWILLIYLNLTLWCYYSFSKELFCGIYELFIRKSYEACTNIFPKPFVLNDSACVIVIRIIFRYQLILLIPKM